MEYKQKKVLVHVCCAPCATYTLEKLKEIYADLTAFFYNPCIQPDSEYEKRSKCLVDFCKQMDYKLIVDKNGFEEWIEATNEFKKEPEGGKRCTICFTSRLEKTFEYAKANNFDAITTTLTISPHKNAKLINKIGKELSMKYCVEFIKEDFKKNNGFKKSIELSKKYDLYRQQYCGCLYSQR